MTYIRWVEADIIARMRPFHYVENALIMTQIRNPAKVSLSDRMAGFHLGHKALSVMAECRCRIFDWRHHIKTCGDMSLSELSVQGGNAQHGTGYQPTHPKFVFEILVNLKINYRDYLFIDLGSGKGRTLFVASEFPFQKIIGVEFAEELHRVACKNARDYRSRTRKCMNIECVHLDAAEFVIPAIPTVFFLFNPFRPPVLIPVLRGLDRSLRNSPRDVLLIYVGAFYAQLIEHETKLRPRLPLGCLSR
jgi:hypothetical protein